MDKKNENKTDIIFEGIDKEISKTEFLLKKKQKQEEARFKKHSKP